MNLEQKAKEFATQSHEGQKRKYTLEPYIIHPESVVTLVRTVEHTEEMLAAAWLHDVVEDCGVGLNTIYEEFGATVELYVHQLSDISKPSDGNRATRKAIDLEHTKLACPSAKTIKLADLIDNTNSIAEYDPKFAKVYLPEKRALLAVLKQGNKILWEICNHQLVRLMDKL